MYRGQTHHRSSTSSRELPEVGAIGLVIAGARVVMVMETTEDIDCPPMGMSCVLVQWTLSTTSGILFGVVLLCILRFIACI